MSTFARDGYFRGPSGPHDAHRGAAALRSFFTWCFSAGGGVGLEHCAVTDDGVRCALEYNCVRWGSHDLPPQAGIGVYERGPDGLLAAVRVYDDVEPPAERPCGGETDSRRGEGFIGPPVPSVEGRTVARGPGLAEPWCAQIPVRADLARRRA